MKGTAGIGSQQLSLQEVSYRKHPGHNRQFRVSPVSISQLSCIVADGRRIGESQVSVSPSQVAPYNTYGCTLSKMEEMLEINKLIKAVIVSQGSLACLPQLFLNKIVEVRLLVFTQET